MELDQIKTCLGSPNPQARMRGLVALRDYAPEVVVPFLKQRMYDKEFVVRSFVAMGFGHKQTDEGFDALLDLITEEQDPNVIAEAANSLAKFGERALPHLQRLFKHNDHWLVRQSIFAALEGEQPAEMALQLCRWGIAGTDPVVKATAVSHLQCLAGTAEQDAALELLLTAARDKDALLRAQAARVLPSFDHPTARAALQRLRQDGDYQVVAATLENLL